MEVIPATTKNQPKMKLYSSKNEKEALFLLSKFDNAMEH